MSTQDQLEIIRPDGQIEFYPLDIAKGLTNIGRDKENDVVLDDPDVASFQAMLDHRKRPYQLVLLSEEGQVSLDGNALSINGPRPLQHLDHLQFGAYTLILVEDDGAIASDTGSIPAATPAVAPIPSKSATVPLPSQPSTPVTRSASFPSHPAPSSPPITRPEAGSGFGARSLSPPAPMLLPASLPESYPTATPQSAVSYYESLPQDVDIDEIGIELLDTEWTVNVEEVAVYELSITNAGPRVAAFQITVDGLDSQWVTISQPFLNLNERRSTTITIEISAPRHPTSYAGVHYFAVRVTSPNYNNRYSQRGATLIINPYYQFNVNELRPKINTISWFKTYGDTQATIFNEGNSEAAFHLEGSDNERQCSYEFQIPGEPTILTGQAPLHIAPFYLTDDETRQPQTASEYAVIPVRIIPRNRPLFLRKRVHRFNITVTPLDGQQTPRTLPGELRQKPLLGLLPLLLLAILFLFLCGSGTWWLFGPRIGTFTIDNEVRNKTIEAGQEVTLGWEASPFANLRIMPDVGRLETNFGQLTVAPKETTTYKLEATNLLSALFPSLLTQEIERTVRVVPIEPSILRFEAAPNNILTGEEVVLSWDVQDADEVFLTNNNGSSEEIPTAEHANGQRVVSPNQDTTYGLEARNFYGDNSQNATVVVVTPTGTPIPPPQVASFFVSPGQIIQGESVTVNWAVTGADSVTINPIGPVPPSGPISHTPLDTTLYTLLAVKEGAPSISRIQEVVVIPPTGTPSPTPTPQAPIIEFFTVSPEELIEGDNTDLELAWSVVGETTNIEITGPDIGTISGLTAQGTIPVVADGATLFILTASNGSLNASQTVQVTSNEPTPTPTSPPPLPIITAFEMQLTDGSPINPISGSSSSQDKTYQIVAGTPFVILWNVENNPTSVSVIGPKVNISGAFPGASTGVLTITARSRYNLTAFNDGGQAKSTMDVLVIPPPAPPPPANFVGFDQPTQNLLEWTYPVGDIGRIEHFKIFRSDLNGFLPTTIPTTGGQPFSFPDTDNPCGVTYTVVAVYIDIITGIERDTDAAANSWAPPCP